MKTFHEYLLENKLNKDNFDQSLYTISGKNYKVSEIADWAKKNLRLVILKISDIQSKYIDSKNLFISSPPENPVPFRGWDEWR